MCHIILLLPLIGLPIFWLAPLPIAMTSYTFLTFFAGWAYLGIARTSHRPVATGQEALLHARGEVIAAHGSHLTVRIMGEIWSARSAAAVKRSEQVRVTGMNGLELIVAPLLPAGHSTGQT